MAKVGLLISILVAFCIQCPANVSGQSLKSLAKSHHKYVGFLVNPTHLTTEPIYAQIADREFDCFTPGNPMKWDTTEPTRGKFNFAAGDIIVNHGQAHGQRVRGHTLVWHAQLPGWVSNGHFNRSELHSILQHHVTTEAAHWKGKIYAWDVVNEVLNGDGTIRDDVFHKTLGKEYIADSFRWAHQADPQAKLYINDYGVEGINRKSTGMLNLVRELLSQHVPVHGVGLQAHFGVGQVPHDIHANIERFAALGVDVAITEIDIAIPLPITHEKLEQQAKDFGQIVQACMEASKCVGVTMSGLTDKHSWIPDATHGKSGAALIYDEHYKEKPAYFAVQKALAGKH